MAYNVAIMGNSRGGEEVDHDAIMKMLDEREERREMAREKRKEMAALKKEREKYKVDIFPIIRSGDCDKLESLLKECHEKFGDDISDVGKLITVKALLLMFFLHSTRILFHTIYSKCK